MNNKNFWTYLGDSFAFFGRVLDTIKKQPVLSILWGFAVLILVFTVVVLILGGLPENRRLIVVLVNVVVLAGALVFTLSKVTNRPPSLHSSIFRSIIVHEKGQKNRTIADAIVKYILDIPQVGLTSSNGSLPVSIPSNYAGRKVIVSAEKDGYKASGDIQIIIKPGEVDPRIFIELEPDNLSAQSRHQRHIPTEKPSTLVSNQLRSAYELLALPGYDLGLVSDILESFERSGNVEPLTIARSRNITPSTIEIIANSMIVRGYLLPKGRKVILTKEGQELLNSLRKYLRPIPTS